MADEQNEQEIQENQRRQAEALRNLTQVFQEAGREIAAHGRVSESTNRKIRDAYEKAAKAGLNLEEALNRASTAAGGWMRIVGGALEDLAQAAISTATTLQRGNKGLTAYDGQINQLTGTVKGVLGSLQALGPGMGAFGKALGLGADAAQALALAATDMGDKLYTSFGALNRAGGAAADGMTGLFNDAKNLGLSMNELSALTDAVAGRAQDFALFGGSVADARKRLGQMGDQLRDNREQFLSLGMTMPEVTEGLANYVSLQSRLGRGQSQTTAQMAESAKKYLMEQDALTKLMGINRQEQEAAQQRALLNDQFQAKIRELQLAGQHDVVDELLKMSRMYAAIGPETQAAFHGAVTNNLAAQETVKGFIASNGEIVRSTQAVINRQMKGTEAVQATGKAMGEYMDSVSVFTGQMNTNSEIAVAINEQNRARILSNKNLSEEEKRIQLEQIAMGAEGAKAQDPLLAAQAKLQTTQIAANDALDNLVKNVLPFVQTGMQELTNGALVAARALNKLGDEPAGTDEEQKALAANTKALEAMQDELGQAQGAYAKAFDGAGIAQRMGIGRTDEQKQAAQRLKELEDKKSRLEAGIQAAQDQHMGADIGGGMGMPGEAPVPESAPSGAAPTSAAGPAPAATGPRGFTEEDLVRRGLKIKAGATQKEGGVIQPNAVDLAEQVQKQIAGFSRITGFDDGHMRSATSKHQQGRAFDFTVEPNPSREEGARIVGQLKGLGASYAQDEYHNRSDNATGPHFHVEVPAMAQGGITEGVSIAGEAGPEAVVPLPDGRTIPVEITDVTKSTLAASIDTLNARLAEVSGPIRLNQQDVMAEGGVGGTIGGFNAWKGYNAGGMTTDLEAIKDIAGSLGAFDRATETITDPQTWQKILQSNIATNVNLGAVEVGTKMGGSDIGIDIGERVKEVMATNSTDITEALRQVKDEFNAAMRQVVEGMQQQKDPAIQMQILQVLNSINQNQSRTADASQRMADVAMN